MDIIGKILFFLFVFFGVIVWEDLILSACNMKEKSAISFFKECFFALRNK